MTLLQTVVFIGTIIWGLVAIHTTQTDEQEKQRTEARTEAYAKRTK